MNKAKLLQALEEKKNPLMKYNLQFFADKGADGDSSDNAGDGDDNQDDDQDNDGSGDDGKKSDKGKTYTQKEIDDMITERLKRERKKQQTKDQNKDDKSGDKDADKSKDDASAKKLTALEEKVLCYDHDIAKEYVKEAIALAKAYVDEDTDMDEALEKVTKKFPQFVKGADSKKKKSDNDDEDEEEDEDETDNKKSWGQRQKGQAKKIDPVEKAFLERNPDIKL